MWTGSMFTDDGHMGILGVQLTVLALREWRRVTHEANEASGYVEFAP